MDLNSFLKSLPDEPARKSFATSCETSIGHLRNVGYGQKSCGPELAVAIERESHGTVTRKELCPDNWQRVWPELSASAA